MTDELLYERLAVSIARSGSPLPRVRGELIRSLDQLYPLLIAPVYRHGLVPHDLRSAHLLNAWVMSSACIPAFLLARRVTGRAWVAYLLAALSLCIPWLVYSSFLLTEVVAYPVFVWALLAMQRAVVAPSRRNDLVALAAVALGFFARTEFAALFLVLPLALLVHHFVRRERLGAHRVLAVAYALIVAGFVAVIASGVRLSSFTLYGEEIHGSLLPGRTPKSLLEHFSSFSLALGVLPFVAGCAWLLANLVRRPATSELQAFACIGSFAVGGLTLEVTTYDLRVGNFVHDRYLFYLAPVVLLAWMCAPLDDRRPRWSLLLP